MTVYSPLMSYENSKIMNCSKDRTKIDRITIHHNATTDQEIAMNTWTVANGKNTSAHYEITDTQIIGCVPEDCTAWHSGDWETNLRSIGLEHLNSSGAPNWGVSGATMAMSAKLIADICKRYNLPINSTTIQPHNHYQATQCPGGLDVELLVKMAQDVANGTSTVDETPKEIGKEINKANKGELSMFIAKCVGGDVNEYVKNGTFVLFNLSRGTYSVLNGNSQVDATADSYKLSTGESLTKTTMDYMVIFHLIMGSKLDYRG